MNHYGKPLTDVTLNDRFWNRFRETVVREGIPYQWKALNDAVEDAEPSHCLRNFRVAAGKEPGEFGGFNQVAGLSFEYDPTIESPCVQDNNGFLDHTVIRQNWNRGIR